MDSFRQWWAKPYSDDMSVSDWFLFMGMLIALSVAWHIILHHLKEL